MTKLSVYFGTEMPDQAWAQTLTEADVVLEPYHPLVKQGGFAEMFPYANRYVYVNPTTIDPWILERMSDPPPLAGIDERWELPRLDLTQAKAMRWAIQTAVIALECDKGQLNGVFVDDLDRLIPDQWDQALEYLGGIVAEHGAEPEWFINRAFPLWPYIENLRAVLLEDITPHLVNFEPPQQQRWLRDMVLGSVRKVKERGVRVHSLGYEDQESTAQARGRDLGVSLASLIDSVTTGADRPLHQWRVSE